MLNVVIILIAFSLVTIVLWIAHSLDKRRHPTMVDQNAKASKPRHIIILLVLAITIIAGIVVAYFGTQFQDKTITYFGVGITTLGIVLFGFFLRKSYGVVL